jgi:hypothetical protein
VSFKGRECLIVLNDAAEIHSLFVGYTFVSHGNYLQNKDNAARKKIVGFMELKKSARRKSTARSPVMIPIQRIINTKWPLKCTSRKRLETFLSNLMHLMRVLK